MSDSDPGVQLSVEPQCVAIGGILTVRAPGREPDAQYEFIIDPRPDPLERGTTAEADAEGPGRSWVWG